MKNYGILFPSYPGRPGQPDPQFSGEYTAAKAADFDVALVDVEVNFGGEVNFYKLPTATTLIYRGWLIQPKYYDMLDLGVRERGSLLCTGPEGYRMGYELPLWYSSVPSTPRSIWYPEETLSEVLPRLPELLSQEFGTGALLLKDWVKSRKQDWHDACYIPDLQDGQNVQRVVKNFMDITGETRHGGLVFRQFIPLKQVGVHPKSRMPLVNEYRAFFFNQELFYLTKYWIDGAVYGDLAEPDPQWVQETAKDVRSPFFTLDVAQTESGEWIPIEVGDGGSSGLPEEKDAPTFYQKLREMVERHW